MMEEEAGEIQREVAEVIKHPNYDWLSNKNDIALQKLKQPLVFTERIQPICMPKS